MVRFHEALARRARDDPHFHFHYVTAREMYNLARAAEAGWKGPVADALDFELVSNLGRAALPRDAAEGPGRANSANSANPGRLTPGARGRGFFMPESQPRSCRRRKERSPGASALQLDR